MAWLFSKREERRAIEDFDWVDASRPPTSKTIDVNRALSLVPVFGAIRLLADSVSSLPPILYKRDKDGIPRRQGVPSLFRNPSVHGTLPDWLFRAVFSMAAQGDAFGLITQRDYYGFPTMVEWLNPDRIVIQDAFLTGPGSYMQPIWWWWGRQIKYTSNPQTSELIHIPWFTMPYKVRGLSPIGAFQATAGIGLGAQEYARSWFDNGGVPPGFFRNSGLTISQQDGESLVQKFTAKLRSRKPLVLGKDWDYEPIAIKPHEADFVNTMKLTATEVATIYGVPPEKIGGATGTPYTYTTAEQGSIDYLKYSVRPWLVRLEAALSKLFPIPYYVKFDVTELLRTDAKTQAEVDALNLGGGGYRQVDEVRVSRDLPPMANGQGQGLAQPNSSQSQQVPPQQVPPNNGQVTGSGQSLNGKASNGNGNKQADKVAKVLAGRDNLGRPKPSQFPQSLSPLG